MLWAILPIVSFAQQNYADFEGDNLIKFGPSTGKLDTAYKNPKVSEVNKSLKCARYMRDKKTRYDYVKILLDKKMSDVSEYATHEGFPSKISMKLYSNAPVGTLVEIQLGSQQNDSFPKVIHSQFQTYTTVQNQWENLVFTFAQTPEGSQVLPKDIDMINILFAPGAEDGSTFFFDDLMMPEISQQTGQNMPFNNK